MGPIVGGGGVGPHLCAPTAPVSRDGGNGWCYMGFATPEARS